jgi:hypothetical protein
LIKKLISADFTAKSFNKHGYVFKAEKLGKPARVKALGAVLANGIVTDEVIQLAWENTALAGCAVSFGRPHANNVAVKFGAGGITVGLFTFFAHKFLCIFLSFLILNFIFKAANFQK